MRQATAVIVAVFLSLSMEGRGQFFAFDREKPPNAVYLAHQPWDLGIGLRYDQHFWKVGAYGSVTYGNWYLYRQAGLKDHWKITAGLLIPIKDYMENKHDISIGLNRHFTKSFEVYDPLNIYDGNKIIDHPWSFELGFTIKMQRFAIAVRTDILHWEPCIDLGIPLNYGERKKGYVKMPKRKKSRFYF